MVLRLQGPKGGGEHNNEHDNLKPGTGFKKKKKKAQG